jgi:hypothetical protein
MPLDGSVTPAAAAVERVCAAFGQPVARVRSEKRDAEIVAVRWACWLVLNDRLECSPSEIAREFGKDHSSVLYGLRKARQRLNHDAEWRARVIEAGDGLKRAFEPPPATVNPNDFDYVVLDRLVGQFRNACVGKLRADPAAFREQYAATYRRIREAIAA